MMRKYKVLVQNFAREDIKEAKKWYEKRQKGLGKRFAADFKSTSAAISRNPASFSIRYSNLRIANFDVFPYAAHFFIDDREGMVYITAIVHTSRHPDIAKERF